MDHPEGCLIIVFFNTGDNRCHISSKRHKFDKAQYRVINSAEYNESLRQRGDLTI